MASGCSCEHVFSCLVACDFGEATGRMCDGLWVRCNGQHVEDWCLYEIFQALHANPFQSRQRKQIAPAPLNEGGSLPLFAAFKDLPVQVLAQGTPLMCLMRFAACGSCLSARLHPQHRPKLMKFMGMMRIYLTVKLKAGMSFLPLGTLYPSPW